MGLAVTLLQESFRKWKGGQPGRIYAQSLLSSEGSEHASGLGRYHLGQTDEQRNGQNSPSVLAKTSADYILRSLPCKSQYIFFCGCVSWSGFLYPGSKWSGLLHSLAYSFWALVIFIHRMETNSITRAQLVRWTWNCFCKMSSVVRIWVIPGYMALLTWRAAELPTQQSLLFPQWSLFL